MKKVVLFVAALALFAAMSCKKCGECSYTFGGVTVNSGERCGDEWDALKTAWSVYPGVQCKEK